MKETLITLKWNDSLWGQELTPSKGGCNVNKIAFYDEHGIVCEIRLNYGMTARIVVKADIGLIPRRNTVDYLKGEIFYSLYEKTTKFNKARYELYIPISLIEFKGYAPSTKTEGEYDYDSYAYDIGIDIEQRNLYGEKIALPRIDNLIGYTEDNLLRVEEKRNYSRNKEAVKIDNLLVDINEECHCTVFSSTFKLKAFLEHYKIVKRRK